MPDTTLPDFFYHTDVHTHRRGAGMITSVEPGEDTAGAERLSVGIHPWHADTGDIEAVRALALSDPRVVAIGECGLDRFRGPSIDIQQEVFEKHILLSEELRLPLVIHCVRAYSDLLALRKKHTPVQPWIIHGFRGKPELAQQLVRQGLYLSLGHLHNLAVPASVPSPHLLRETDSPAQ
ncbi:MAG: TatD family hydrolase [Muribaculaceae bacterium]